jgi:hypothetical protein
VEWENPIEDPLTADTNGSDQTTIPLPAGDYYVRVRPNPQSSNTLYALTLFQP